MIEDGYNPFENTIDEDKDYDRNIITTKPDDLELISVVDEFESSEE